MMSPESIQGRLGSTKQTVSEHGRAQMETKYIQATGDLICSTAMAFSVVYSISVGAGKASGRMDSRHM